MGTWLCTFREFKWLACSLSFRYLAAQDGTVTDFSSRDVKPVFWLSESVMKPRYSNCAVVGDSWASVSSTLFPAHSSNFSAVSRGKICEMWHCHSVAVGNTNLLGCETELVYEWLPMFQRNAVHWPSQSRGLGLLLSWRWRHCGPSIRQEPLTQWYSIIFQKMWIPIAKTVCTEGEKWHRFYDCMITGRPCHRTGTSEPSYHRGLFLNSG